MGMRMDIHGENHHWWALSTVALATFMSTLDSSIVNISLPTIMAYFKANLPTVEWVVLVYLLVSTGLLLPFGSLSDMVGRKKMFRLGIMLFTLGSGLCSISQSAGQLIAFRGLQAVGAAMVMTNSFTIVTSVFPPQQRGRALGITGACVAVSFTVGPTLGGLLIGTLGWRSIFYVNLPIGVIGTLMATYILEERRVSPTLGQKMSFDFPGAVLIVVGLTALLLGLTTGQHGDWTSVQVVSELVVAAIALVLLPLREARANHPLIHLALFRIRVFSFGCATNFLSFLAGSANAFLMPFYLQLALGYSPLHAGLLMTPTAVAIAVVSPISGWLSDRLSARILCSLGLAIVCAMLVSISMLNTRSSSQLVLALLTLLGIGQGIFQAPNNNSVMGSVPRQRISIAGGILPLMRNTGQVVGMALAGTILASALVTTVGQASLDSLHTGVPPAQDSKILQGFMMGMRRAYLAAALVCFLGVWASLIRGKQASPDEVTSSSGPKVETKP